VSFKQPLYTGSVNALAVTRILEEIKAAEEILGKRIKFYQASSSELWGTTPPIQNENSLMCPQSPYGVAKLYAYWITKCYRNSYNMFASNGILHNHESPRRGINFVTRKITRQASRIKLGIINKIELGNLDAIRDWGHSKCYMRAVNMIMEYKDSEDWVVSTGEGHTVREFAEETFKCLGLDFYKYLVLDDSLKRASEVPALIGDSTKIRAILGWKPEITFTQLIKEMVDNDMREAENGLRINS
jgi:GDPmannose 4,6-dehydratase